MTAWPVTGLTSFCSVLQVSLRNVHKWFISGLAHANVLCGQVRSNYCERLKLRSFWHGITVLTSCLVLTVLVQEPHWRRGTCGMDGNWASRTVCRKSAPCVRSKIGASTTVLHLLRIACCVLPRGMVMYGGTSAMGARCAGICVSRSLQSFGEATRLPRMLVACRSVPVRPFLVSLSRNVGVMRSISVAALHLVSFSSHHIHLHVRSVWSHAASLFPYSGGCVCASRGGLENACDWPSV